MSKNEKRIYWTIIIVAVGLGAAAMLIGCVNGRVDPLGWLDIEAEEHAPPAAGGQGAPVLPPGADALMGLLPSPWDLVAATTTGTVIPGLAALWLAIRGRRRKRAYAVIEDVLDVTRAAIDESAPEVKRAVTKRIAIKRAVPGGVARHRAAIEASRARARR